MRNANPLAVFLFVASTLNAQKITTFDVPSGIETTPTGISPSGEIVGYYGDTKTTTVHGFVRNADGTFTLFAPPNATSVSVTGINPSREIVGSFEDTTSHEHAFLRKRNGTITMFDFPGAIGTAARAISESGQIVGFYVAASEQHGFIRQPDGSITSFDVPGNSSRRTNPTAIDSSGQITGSYVDIAYLTPQDHGFLRDPDGNITTFAVSVSDYDTYPATIGLQGQIVGSATDDNALLWDAFLREPDGIITTFNATRGYNAQPADQTIATAINSSRQIAGYWRNNDLPPDDTFSGFLRSADGTMTTFTVPGATNTLPVAINSRGVITGSYTDSTGQHGFVRTP